MKKMEVIKYHNLRIHKFKLCYNPSKLNKARELLWKKWLQILNNLRNKTNN